MSGYSLRKLLSNIKYLMQVNLREREIENRFETLLYAEDLCRFDVLDPDDQVKIPKILSPQKSLELLLENRNQRLLSQSQAAVEKSHSRKKRHSHTVIDRKHEHQRQKKHTKEKRGRVGKHKSAK